MRHNEVNRVGDCLFGSASSTSVRSDQWPSNILRLRYNSKTTKWWWRWLPETIQKKSRISPEQAQTESTWLKRPTSKFKVQLEMPRIMYEFSFSTRLDQESDSCWSELRDIPWPDGLQMKCRRGSLRYRKKARQKRYRAMLNARFPSQIDEYSVQDNAIALLEEIDVTFSKQSCRIRTMRNQQTYLHTL